MATENSIIDEIVKCLHPLDDDAKLDGLIVVAQIASVHTARVEPKARKTGNPTIDAILKQLHELDEDALQDCKIAIHNLAAKHDAHLKQVRQRRASCKVVRGGDHPKEP